MDSILNTIKKMLGLSEDYTPFDTDITVLINSALMTLTQANVGPAEGYRITGPDNNWDEFLTNSIMLEPAKEYIYLKVKLIFDPPSSSAATDAMKTAIDEILWRLIVQSESVDTFEFMSEDSLVRGGSAINAGVIEEDDYLDDDWNDG